MVKMAYIINKWKKNSTGFFSHSTIFVCLIVSLLLSTLLFAGCLQPDPLVDSQGDLELTSEDLEQGKRFAIQWFIQQFNEQHYFNYIYNPDTNEYPPLDNLVRQLLASRLLAEMSQENETVVIHHKNNLEYVFSQWYVTDNLSGCMYDDRESNLGANAMALRTLVASPFYDEYEPVVVHLTETILSLQQENGSFDPFFIVPDYQFDESHLIMFFSGEAILALFELYEKTKNESIYDAAVRSQQYYLNHYVDDILVNYNPSYVPWHTQTLYHLYNLTKNDTYATAIFIMNDKLIEMQERTNTSVIGRFYDPLNPSYGYYHSSSDALYSEGLVYAYILAKELDEVERMQSYQTAFLLGAHNLLTLQYTNKSDPLSFGGIRNGIDDGRIRVDNNVHAIEALNDIIYVIKPLEPWKFTYEVSTATGVLTSS